MYLFWKKRFFLLFTIAYSVFVSGESHVHITTEQLGTSQIHSQVRQQIGSLISFRNSQPVDPQFCVIVRTYWGHSAGENGGLRRLIRSLRRQTVQRWEAIFLVMDNTPFTDLHHILSEFEDDRLWVFAEWIGHQFMPKKDADEWMPGYHGMLYNLTDDAIQVCPKDTRWLMITNGDNEYAEHFMHKVAEAGDTDLVAFDFYSRFQRPTAPACERFNAWSDRPNCKRNRLKWCHTDLGANAINYPKFITEQRRFGTLESSLGLQADHFDGIMAETLVESGWRVVQYENECLFSHAPNPQWCAWQNGVWSDIDIVSWSSSGGRCISQDERNRILSTDSGVEEVSIHLSNDGNITAFEGFEERHLLMRCLRKRETLEPQLQAMYWYSAMCTEDADLPAFDYLMSEHQEYFQAMQEAAAGGDMQSSEEGYLPPQLPAIERTPGWKPEMRKKYDPPQEEWEMWEALDAEQQLLAQQAEQLAKDLRPQTQDVHV